MVEIASPGADPIRRSPSAGLPRTAFWLRIAFLTAAVLALEIYGRFFADPAFMSPPSAIVHALFSRVLSDPHIVEALAVCTGQIAAAYTLAAIVGIGAGVAIGLTRFGQNAFMPIILLLFAIPQVTLLPLVILAFGLGPEAKIAFGFSHGVFPVLVNVVAGMRGVKPLHVRAARAMGARRMDVIRHVMLPNAIPSLFAGLRLAMTLTLLGVILAELYVSTGGIGYYTRAFAEDYDPAPLFALIGALAIIAVVFNELVRVAERQLTPGMRRPHNTRDR